MSIMVILSIYMYRNHPLTPKKQIVQNTRTEKPYYNQDYHFTTNWFTPHIRVWEEILKEFSGKADLRYLEIGVFEGRSFIWMLENVLTHPSARLTAVDVFADDLEDRFVNNIKKSGFGDKVEILKGKSQEMLRQLPRESYDIIYIDGSHRAKHVFLDAALSWDLLKHGGLLIFDDYLWNINLFPVDLIPKGTIDNFLMAFGEEMELVHQGYQLIVRKTGWPCERYNCSTVGRYGYVWTERTLYEISTDKPVHLDEEEKTALEQFLMSYVGIRLKRTDVIDLITRKQVMRKLQSRLALVPEVKQ
jgi:Methyltransferase domain